MLAKHGVLSLNINSPKNGDVQDLPDSNFHCNPSSSNIMTCFIIVDLPSCSPLLHSLLRNLECWESQLTADMDRFEQPADDYVPGLYKDVTATGPNINKYKSMLNPDNTPFR